MYERGTGHSPLCGIYASPDPVRRRTERVGHGELQRDVAVGGEVGLSRSQAAAHTSSASTLSDHHVRHHQVHVVWCPHIYGAGRRVLCHQRAARVVGVGEGQVTLRVGPAPGAQAAGPGRQGSDELSQSSQLGLPIQIVSTRLEPGVGADEACVPCGVAPEVGGQAPAGARDAGDRAVRRGPVHLEHDLKGKTQR